MKRPTHRLHSPALLLVALALPAPRAAAAALPPLIPREVLLSAWNMEGLELSPDGTRLAWLAGDEPFPANIWMMTIGSGEPRRVTSNRTQGIQDYQWSPDGTRFLYVEDEHGDENWHVHVVDIATGQSRDLTPFDGVRAQDILTSPNHPDEILVGMNKRDPRINDIHRVNLQTGAVTLEAENPGDVISWTTDQDFVIRACTAFTGTEARTVIRVRDDAASPWRDLVSIPFGDAPFAGQANGGSLIAGFAPGGKSLYIVEPRFTDRTRLVEIDATTGEPIREIAADPEVDVETATDAGLRSFRPLVATDPATGLVQAVGFYKDRLTWRVVDPAVRADFDSLAARDDGDLHLVNRAKRDSLWFVHATRADGPEAYYLYDRATRKARKLQFGTPRLAEYTLAPVTYVTIKARDGLDIPAYLTRPVGLEPKNLPLVVVPHGGPWFRDRWEFDPWVQLLANRGYAVIQPQYRGSTGYGKAFLNASNRQFGNGAVLADIVDAANWAVSSGLADKERLAIMGGSGGGYAALCAITFKPDLWRAAVNVVGPSSVKTLLESIPAYWKPVKQRWVNRLGDAEHDPDWERAVSPVHHAGNIKAPLLMAYGLNDPRVHIREAEQMAAAMRARELPLEFVVYPDEGHMFARIENNMDFFGRVEEFLARHLGGRKEPWVSVPGSSVAVR
jgi:dipeptidyl aminopeptidase/acylaminoacyl peptidase